MPRFSRRKAVNNNNNHSINDYDTISSNNDVWRKVTYAICPIRHYLWLTLIQMIAVRGATAITYERLETLYTVHVRDAHASALQKHSRSHAHLASDGFKEGETALSNALLSSWLMQCT